MKPKQNSLTTIAIVVKRFCFGGIPAKERKRPEAGRLRGREASHGDSGEVQVRLRRCWLDSADALGADPLPFPLPETTPALGTVALCGVERERAWCRVSHEEHPHMARATHVQLTSLHQTQEQRALCCPPRPWICGGRMRLETGGPHALAGQRFLRDTLPVLFEPRTADSHEDLGLKAILSQAWTWQSHSTPPVWIVRRQPRSNARPPPPPPPPRPFHLPHDPPAAVARHHAPPRPRLHVGRIPGELSS